MPELIIHPPSKRQLRESTIVQMLQNPQFGRWTVNAVAACRGHNDYWLCQCDCGTWREVSGTRLRRGESKSCGCLKAEVARQRMTRGGIHSNWKGGEFNRGSVANAGRMLTNARHRAAKLGYAAPTITPDGLAAFITAHAGKCDICGGTDQMKHLALDHCHATGNVRGLLCEGCNRGIGCLGDSATRLEQAASYLRKAA